MFDFGLEVVGCLRTGKVAPNGQLLQFKGLPNLHFDT